MSDEGISIQCDSATFDDFKIKLDNLKRNVAGPLKAKALRAGAAVVFGAIQDAAPRKTGRLKADLQWKPTKNGVVIFFNQAWPWTAMFMERGTKNHFDWKGTRISADRARRKRQYILNVGSESWHVDPAKHAFMMKAFKAAAPAAMKVMYTTLATGIEAAANT